MTTNKNKLGFTLIELTLSMAFIGILLMATVAVAIHFSSLYSKGIAMKSINQAGRELGDIMVRDALSAARTKDVFVEPTKTGAGNMGRLCLGRYSYLWSSADGINTGDFATYSDDPTTTIIMARVLDVGATYCKETSPGTYPTLVNKATAQELLPVTNGEYAIHSLEVSRIPDASVAATQEVLFNIRYTVGTNDTGSIDAGNQSCLPPDVANVNENFPFCSVNNFEVIARAEY